MSSCATVPTETQFATQIITSDSLSTFFSTSVSTEPPTTLTSTTTTCLDAITSATCSTTSVLTTIVTQPGSTTTVSVPVTSTVPVTLTSSNPTKTLFSTSCAPTTDPPTTTSITTTSTTSSTPITTTPTPTSSLSDTLPAVTSASSLTLSNGTVVTTDVVLTATLAPSSVYVTSTAPSFNNGGNNSPSRKTAPIVGGVVGGVIGLLAIIGGIWYLWRRSKRWNDIFDQEEDEKENRRRMSLDEGEDVQPRPYHYGLVGQSTSPTPPSSPPSGPSHSPSNSVSVLNAPANVHSRSLSGLSGALGTISRSGSDLAVTSASGHVRPNLSSASSAASTRPLLERPVNPTRPPSSWSLNTQGAGADSGRAIQPAPLSPRPHSAGSSLPSGAAPATVPGRGASASPVSEKRRLREALPPGAAAPIPPIPTIPGPATSSAQAPPLTPRSPQRPSSANKPVFVHMDGGSASGPSATGNQPPAYSPT